LPFIKEDIGDLLAAQNQLSDRAAQKRLRPSHFAEYAEVCRNQIQRQNQQFLEHPAFVCDRFAVDVLARVLRPPFDRIGEACFQSLLDSTRQQIGGLDLIVVTPLSNWSFEASTNDMGRERNAAVLPKTRIHSLYSGLCATLALERTLFLPGGDTRHERWIPLVLNALTSTSSCQRS
jgi:hypothetical protein